MIMSLTSASRMFANRLAGVLVIAAALGAVFVSTDGFAADGIAASGGSPGGVVQSGSYGSAVAPAPPKWTDSSKYQACGQSCIYQKSNETLSLDATYVMKKLELLQSASDDEIRETLGAFCTSGEDGRHCLERYRMYETARLYKTRNAIGTNDDSAAKLALEKRKDGSGPTFAQSGEERKSLLPLVPEVMSTAEMQQNAEKLKYLSSNAYQEWKNSRPVKPSIEDFYVFKPQPREPGNPSAGSGFVLDTSPAAKKKAEDDYKKAMEKYAQAMSDFKKEWDNTWDTRINSKTGDAPNLQQAQTKPALTKTQVDAFKDARALIIETANKSLIDSGFKAGRSPAGQGSAGKLDKNGLKTSAPCSAQEPNMIPVQNRGKDEFHTVTWQPDDLGGAAFDLIQ